MASHLTRRGFLALLATQFFGAANDNILKQVLTFMVATGIWARALGEGGQAYVALCLTLPFILLSGLAGQIADRFGKQRVMLVVKIAEVPIATLALVGLVQQNLALTLGAFLLLATQSAFFGPAKYGVIPELVEPGDLSRANGALNMFTNLAIIAGTMVAGPLSDLYQPADGGGRHGEALLWAPGVALVAVALLGLGSVLLMPRLRAADAALRFDLNPFGTYLTSFRQMWGRPIFLVALAWSFFSLIGLMALLILPEYAAILDIDYTRNSYLLGALGIAIGAGSVLAGWISGHHIKPRLIPVGGAGMALFFFLLGSVTPEYWSVGVMISGAGAFAGFYMIPLQALLQKLAPDEERGRFLGTANALSFCFGSIGAAIYWLATNRLGLAPNRVFLICGGLILAWTTGAMIGLRGVWRDHARV